jgi:putative DNA methylase
VLFRLGGACNHALPSAIETGALCERKKRSTEALAYNGLVQSWPEVTRLAREGAKPQAATQGKLFEEPEE